MFMSFSCLNSTKVRSSNTGVLWIHWTTALDSVACLRFSFFFTADQNLFCVVLLNSADADADPAQVCPQKSTAVLPSHCPLTSRMFP